MIIKKISIKKFRGFSDANFQLGQHLTVIAGQNGTQKTTLLGMLSQPFSITDKENPLYGEKPLCGGSFKSAFAEKFKLSDTFDTPKSHEWTLSLNKDENSDFTVESIKRSSSSNSIRFWKKGDRSKGSGYIQKPVIYLSLSRLLPIGEDNSLDPSNEIELTDEDFKFYQKWHNKILIIHNVQMTGVDYLASKQKNTLGANTSFYDWKMNSSGQDNIGKILLAILSFKRLKKKHGDAYQGGILAIDELDATLYPASQLKLIEALRKFASQMQIQIVFTTHSLTILEQTCTLQSDPRTNGQIKVVYLEKVDSEIKVVEDLLFESIQHRLNLTMKVVAKVSKVPVFSEDNEAIIFFKALLKRRSSSVQCLDCSLGCDNLIELSRKNIPGLKFPDSMIVLDGDVRMDTAKMKRIDKLQNVILLPGNNSPERLLSTFLYKLSDSSPIWNNISDGYSKQFVFRDYSFQEIQGDRVKAKAWFNAQKENWGRGCVRVINPWIDNNQEDVDSFLEDFDALYEKYAKALSL